MNDTFVPYCCLLWWWLYNMLENYKTDKLHHPYNDNTRTMQKQYFFFWVTNFRQEQPTLHSFFMCVHMLCACYVAHTLSNCSRQMQIAHSSLKNKIINLTDVGKDGSVTESHNSWGCNLGCRVFRGYWSQVSDLDLTKFPPSNMWLGALNTLRLYGIFPTD